MRTDSLDVSSLVSYINDIKPFHSKLTTVVVEYQANDNVFVNIVDKSKFEMKFSSVWELDFVSDGRKVQYRIPAAVFPRHSDDFHQCTRRGVLDEVPGTPGAYAVPYNNGVEVSVNGVVKKKDLEYTIDDKRTTVQFTNPVPVEGDEVCLNWRVVDRVFIAINGVWQFYDLEYNSAIDGLEMFPYDASKFDSAIVANPDLEYDQTSVRFNPIGRVRIVPDSTGKLYYVFEFDQALPLNTTIKIRVEQREAYNGWTQTSIVDTVKFADLIKFYDTVNAWIVDPGTWDKDLVDQTYDIADLDTVNYDTGTARLLFGIDTSPNRVGNYDMELFDVMDYDSKTGFEQRGYYTLFTIHEMLADTIDAEFTDTFHRLVGLVPTESISATFSDAHGIDVGLHPSETVSSWVIDDDVGLYDFAPLDMVPYDSRSNPIFAIISKNRGPQTTAATAISEGFSMLITSAVSSAPARVPLFMDTFDGDAGTNLVGRVPNVGPTWGDMSEYPAVMVDDFEYSARSETLARYSLDGSGGMWASSADNEFYGLTIPMMIPSGRAYFEYKFILNQSTFDVAVGEKFYNQTDSKLYTRTVDGWDAGEYIPQSSYPIGERYFDTTTKEVLNKSSEVDPTITILNAGDPTPLYPAKPGYRKVASANGPYWLMGEIPSSVHGCQSPYPNATYAGGPGWTTTNYRQYPGLSCGWLSVGYLSFQTLPMVDVWTPEPFAAYGQALPGTPAWCQIFASSVTGIMYDAGVPVDDTYAIIDPSIELNRDEVGFELGYAGDTYTPSGYRNYVNGLSPQFGIEYTLTYEFSSSGLEIYLSDGTTTVLAAKETLGDYYNPEQWVNSKFAIGNGGMYFGTYDYVNPNWSTLAEAPVKITKLEIGKYVTGGDEGIEVIGVYIPNENGIVNVTTPNNRIEITHTYGYNPLVAVYINDELVYPENISYPYIGKIVVEFSEARTAVIRLS